jgi:hypothetical protein
MTMNYKINMVPSREPVLPMDVQESDNSGDEETANVADDAGKYYMYTSI